MEHGSAVQKELAKQRRKAIKEVVKAVTDPHNTLDNRLRFLQAKFVQMVQDQNKQDKDMLAMQVQLDAAVKESAQGVL